MLSNVGGADIQNSAGFSNEPAIEVRQWMDDADDGFFYLAIPLDLFTFATDVGDAKSVFNVQAQIDRFLPNRQAYTSREVRDWTERVAVDFVDPN